MYLKVELLPSHWVYFTTCHSWSSVTTSGNSQQRSGGSKLGQISKLLGGLSVINAMTATQLKEAATTKKVGTASTGDEIYTAMSLTLRHWSWVR